MLWIKIFNIYIMNILPLYLLITLFIGFFFIYSVAPIPKIVMKHPKLSNVNSTIFMDDNNVCYKYKPVKIKC